MKKFLLKLFVYATVLSMITLFINAVYIYKNTEIDSDIGAFISGVPQNIQVCNFGSSHGLYGFNYEGKDNTCFNFALSSQTLMYDNRILQCYRDKIQKNAHVFIVISYFSFLGKSEINRTGFASQNRRYYKFLPSRFITQYDWKTDMYVNYFPALITEFPQLLKTLLSMGKKENNANWDKETDAMVAYKDAQAACRRHIITDKMDEKGNLIYSEDAFDAIYSIIKTLKEIGAKPVLVTTPFLDEYNIAIEKNAPCFLNDFHSIMEKIVQNTGVKYYDYSHDKRFCNNYSFFRDSDHLNRKGAKAFTDILFREVMGVENLAQIRL